MSDAEVLYAAFRWRRLVQLVRACYGQAALDAAETVAKYRHNRDRTGDFRALVYWRDVVRLALDCRHAR